jgi:hypothetical protein
MNKSVIIIQIHKSTFFFFYCILVLVVVYYLLFSKDLGLFPAMKSSPLIA